MKFAKGDILSYHSKLAKGFADPIGPIEYDVYHLGIYTGESVIHFDENRERIVETSLEDFADGEDVYCTPNYSRVYSDDEIVKRARERLGPRAFDVINNNCEHFIYEVTKDDPSSPQADRFKEKIKSILKTHGL